MDFSSVGIFDLKTIAQACWQTCDEEPGSFPVPFSSIPEYRDESTKTEFFGLAVHFGCVSKCEQEYEIKRIAFIVPMVIIGLTVIGLFFCCWFCQGCLLYRWRKADEKESQLLGSSSASVELPRHTVQQPPFYIRDRSRRYSIDQKEQSKATPTFGSPVPRNEESSKTKRKGSKGKFGPFETLKRSKSHDKKPSFDKLDSSIKSNVSINSWVNNEESRRYGNGMRHTGRERGKSIKAKERLGGNHYDQLDASFRSNVSVNSWVGDENKEGHRERFMRTATNLGKKLVTMDKKSEERDRTRRDKRRHKVAADKY